MTESEVRGLVPGVYLLKWKSPQVGSSVAAVGCNSRGQRWYAPIDWTMRLEEEPRGLSWDTIARATLLMGQEGGMAIVIERDALERRAETAEAVLADLYNERRAESAMARDERERVLRLLRARQDEHLREASRWIHEWKQDQSRPSQIDSEGIARTHEAVAGSLGNVIGDVERLGNNPAPIGAMLSRLTQALETLKQLNVILSPMMVSPDFRQNLQRALRVIKETLEGNQPPKPPTP